jgi:hypothetical protein
MHQFVRIANKKVAACAIPVDQKRRINRTNSPSLFDKNLLDLIVIEQE